MRSSGFATGDKDVAGATRLPWHPVRQLTSDAESHDNRGAQRFSLLTRWPAVNNQDPKDRRPFSTAGHKLDDVIGDTVKRVEDETRQLLDYINDEVVPMVRQHSTKGLRIASDKLKELADYMESAQQKKG